MARPRLGTPNYKLVKRGDRYYVKWWECARVSATGNGGAGRWVSVSTWTSDRTAANRFLANFLAGGTCQ
jgi:hypothetical protein